MELHWDKNRSYNTPKHRTPSSFLC